MGKLGECNFLNGNKKTGIEQTKHETQTSIRRDNMGDWNKLNEERWIHKETRCLRKILKHVLLIFGASEVLSIDERADTLCRKYLSVKSR